MEEKKKSNVGLVILIVILLLTCVGMGCYIGYDKLLNNKEDKTTKIENTKDNTEETTNDVSNNDTIQLSYYETKQEGTEKYNLTLINTGKNSGYFSLNYVSVTENGSEAPSTNGYYSIKDNQLVLSVGPYTNESNLNNTNADNIFKKVGANLEVDPEQDYRNSNPPSYYNQFSTAFNENKITVGTKTFYKVK
ncbi:MAG: hypothetical protein E7160_01220 [Firmicutes bacterium]|nr:hypothetical protein [Bacillota bacterium]